MIFSAAGSPGSVFVVRTRNESWITFAGGILPAAGSTDTDLTVWTAYQIRCAFAAFAVGGIVRTNAVDGLYGVAVLFGKAFVLTLGFGIDFIIVAFAEADIRVAVADAEETDAGGLIGA